MADVMTEEGGSPNSTTEGAFTVPYLRVELLGHTYFVPRYALHRPAVTNFLNGQLYEPLTHRFVAKFFEKVSGSMIHAGTFFGDMLPSFSSRVDGRLYAFEPVLENYVLARLCVQENNLDNVILNNVALSDRFTNLRIDTSEPGQLHAGGGSRIASHGAICSALPVDALGAEDIVLVHLDVEGHELIALRGAAETLARCRPVVAIEDNPRNCGPFLEERGYRVAARIPELTIWVPAENAHFHEVISAAVG